MYRATAIDKILLEIRNCVWSAKKRRWTYEFVIALLALLIITRIQYTAETCRTVNDMCNQGFGAFRESRCRAVTDTFASLFHKSVRHIYSAFCSEFSPK